jgi:hypothetical protein
LELNVADWEPPAELTRLLDALAAEIAAAADGEMQTASTETVADVRATVTLVFRMRELIDDAIEGLAATSERLVLPESHLPSDLRQRPH